MYLVLVSFQGGVALELVAAVVLPVPDRHGAVEAGGGEIPSAGRPTDRANSASVSLGEDGLQSPLSGLTLKEEK